MKNFLTVDVEEWFQRHNFSDVIKRDDWNKHEDRVEFGTKKILEIFAKHNVKGTFFILGWVAKRHPALIKEIADSGHEIATHGYDHSLIYKLTPEAFRQDLRKSIKVLEDITGQKVLGHRAPSYSLTKDALWAFDILKEEGIIYDSSILSSVFYSNICLDVSDKGQCKLRNDLIEVPFSVINLLGVNIPVGGGGNFRIYPYFFTKQSFLQVNKKRPAMFYIHPNDIDAGQPFVKIPFFKKFKEYTGKKNIEKKLETLLSDFEFGSIKEILKIQ